MDLGIKGKTVIVTGGGSNIGRYIVLGFAQEAANTIIADIDEKQAQKVADQANKLGGKTIAIKTDITKLDSVEATVKKTLELFGKIDVLVNNVGYDMVQLFTETTPEFWEKVISLNYRGNLNCCKTMLPHMIGRKYGRIISIGSDAGRMGEFRESVYAGCKGGVIAFSKAIARENGRYGITVNVVCPGVIAPESPDAIGEASMWKEMGPIFTPEVLQKAAQAYPLRRLGTGQDIANMVVFLASDRASYITGQTISVSGGYTMM